MLLFKEISFRLRFNAHRGRRNNVAQFFGPRALLCLVVNLSSRRIVGGFHLNSLLLSVTRAISSPPAGTRLLFGTW